MHGDQVLKADVDLAQWTRPLEEVRVVSAWEAQIYRESLLKTSGAVADFTARDPLEQRLVGGAEDVAFLCHPDSQRSCAGCCDDFRRSRDYLEGKYRLRRSLYGKLVKKRKDFFGYKRRVRELEPDDDESCPYVAFLDDGEQAVGCLLHPKLEVNEGVDLRNHGKYGQGLCEAYICAGLSTLRQAGPMELVFFCYLQRACRDWYSYSRLFCTLVSHLYHRGLTQIFLDHILAELSYGSLDWEQSHA
jgi:hypothetical protein